MSNTINNFTGYMLGNGVRLLQPGQVWWAYDTPVFVCLDINKAYNSLMHSWSDKNSIGWTTIYRVKAPRIRYDRRTNDILWTRDASKIIVDAIVYNRNGADIDDEVLLNRARFMMPAFAKLIKGKGK